MPDADRGEDGFITHLIDAALGVRQPTGELDEELA
jgi:hypothetical protein